MTNTKPKRSRALHDALYDYHPGDANPDTAFTDGWSAAIAEARKELIAADAHMLPWFPDVDEILRRLEK